MAVAIATDRTAGRVITEERVFSPEYFGRLRCKNALHFHIRPGQRIYTNNKVRAKAP